MKVWDHFIRALKKLHSNIRIKNARLEEQLKALDDEKAKQTKRVAEMNRIGG